MSSSPAEAGGLQQLSPFQLKDLLIRSARDLSRSKAATHNFLDAGRGNPNWVATTPREAFFTLGRFALSESKRIWDEPGIGGMPHADGIADRLRRYVGRAEGLGAGLNAGLGADLLRRALDYAVGVLHFDADSFVHELFSLFALLDEDDVYERRCRAIIHERLARLAQGLRVPVPPDPLRVGYYVDLDLEVWGRKEFGEDFVRYAQAHRQPVEVVLGLARRHGTVLLNGGGFEGPPWTVRVSLANLDADDYEAIGRDLRETMQRALAEWKRLTGQGG